MSASFNHRPSGLPVGQPLTTREPHVQRFVFLDLGIHLLKILLMWTAIRWLHASVDGTAIFAGVIALTHFRAIELLYLAVVGYGTFIVRRWLAAATLGSQPIPLPFWQCLEWLCVVQGVSWLT